MTKTMKQTSAGRILNRLTFIEVGVPRLEPDCRRVLRGEREALQAAMRSGDAERIDAAKAEAIRVADMWGVKL